MGEAVGTPQKFTFDGITYDVMPDTNISFKRGKFDKEGIATSGKTLIKMTKRVEVMESLTLGAELTEMEELKAKAESLVSAPMALTFADGSVYRSTGHIKFDAYESDSGKVTLTLIPTGDWTPFLA